MNRPRLTPLAQRELHDRAAYLESRRRGYARRFLAAFDATARRVARSPASVARCGSDHPKLRELRLVAIDGFPNLLILFRVTGTEAEILRIIHGAQDIEGMADEVLPG